ncbi:MAG: MazG nucleotide pyrophosphohydrolase domain-containing protein [Saprospiraceae bacterium]
MEIKDYQVEVDNWIRNVGVRYFSELTNMAILTEEVGEVARLMARIYGEQSFKIPMTQEDQMAKLADELADVVGDNPHTIKRIDFVPHIKKHRKKSLRDNEYAISITPKLH